MNGPREGEPGAPEVPAPEPEVPLSEERSDDDRDEGWGERSAGGFDDDWYLSQRPPHWE